MAAMGMAAYRSTDHLLEANRWVRHTFLVIAGAEDVHIDLVGIESACRGYVATGDTHFLESVEGMKTRRTESRKLVRMLPADNPSQQSRLGVLESAIDTR